MKFNAAEYWKEYRAKNAEKFRLKRATAPIKKVSRKMQKSLAVYAKEKKAFLETIEHCEFPGCEVVNVTLHHMAGRVGSLLTDQSNFKALCWVHHNWCEENPAEAKEMNLSKDRL